MQVIEAPCPNGVASNMEAQVSADMCGQNLSAPEAKDTSESYSSQKIPLKSSEDSMMNHEDTLEVIQIIQYFRFLGLLTVTQTRSTKCFLCL